MEKKIIFETTRKGLKIHTNFILTDEIEHLHGIPGVEDVSNKYYSAKIELGHGDLFDIGEIKNQIAKVMEAEFVNYITL